MGILHNNSSGDLVMIFLTEFLVISLIITLNETGQASKMVQDLVPDIKKTAKLINEISLASQEQSSGSEQINTAMQALNQTTQENAASSENIASVSEELSTYANQLSNLVSRFKVKL